MKIAAIASVLAFLFLTSWPTSVIAQDAKPEAGKQVELSFKTSDGAEVEYLLYLPKDYDATGTTTVPLMLFLHGRGESNGPLSLVAKWGPPKMAQDGKEMPFMIVSPQCPKEDYWSSETQLTRLSELIKEITSTYEVDEKRFYLTGLSMGGYGSWALAAKHPEKFAAVVPVCGGGDPETADKLKDIPIWAWHGDQDRAVPFQKSVDMVEAIKKAGGNNIRFTSLEGIGHNCWSPAYATPQVYQWMMRHSTKEDSDSAPASRASASEDK